MDTVYPLRYNARAVRDDKFLNPERERLAAEMMLHLDLLYRVAFYLAKNDADAQDCVQETCARALHAHRQFASGTNLKAWLTRILYNFFFDASARDKKAISKDGLTGEATQGSSYWETVAADDPGPEDEILQQELSTTITHALRKIPRNFARRLYLWTWATSPTKRPPRF